MTRKELTLFIREEIAKLVIDELKTKQSAPIIEKKDEITEDELDDILFNGGEKKFEKNPITIKESMNKVRITTSEIKSFENNFKNNVSPLVNFDQQKNGHSLFLYKGEDGIEARSSGKIKINAANEISWRFSIQDGADIKASLKLNEDNFDLITKLYHFYDTWQQEWAQKLAGSSNPDQDTKV